MSDTASASSAQESPEYEAPIGNSPLRRLDAKNARRRSERMQKLLEVARGLTATGYIPTAGYGAMDIVGEVNSRANLDVTDPDDAINDYWNLTPDQIGEIMDAYREGNSHE